MLTLEILQSLLKTSATDFEQLHGLYNQYQSYNWALSCANINNETEIDQALHNEFQKRFTNSFDTDPFFIEFKKFHDIQVDKAYNEVFHIYKSIVDETITSLNLYKITNKLKLLSSEKFLDLCNNFDPKLIINKIEKNIKIIDNENNDFDECRFDLYKEILFKYNFNSIMDILEYCND